MKIELLIGPSAEELRPFGPTLSPTPEPRPSLVDLLVKGEVDDLVTHAMAVASGYAYGDLDTFAMLMARMGLEENHCLYVGEYVDALLITTASYLLQSADGRVAILAYRGTPPTSLITILTDLDIESAQITLRSPASAGDYDVHAGIYRNVRATHHVVVAALTRAIEGRSIRPDGGDMPNPLEALYITGHSLGGASAGLLAAMIKTGEDEYSQISALLKGVYTFGAPMFGSPAFAAACDKDDFLREKVRRYVFENDFAPQIPVKENGPYAHSGQEFQYKGGAWKHNKKARGQTRNLIAVMAAPFSFAARTFPLTKYLPFPVSLYDHLPRNYVDALTPEGDRSEFGD